MRGSKTGRCPFAFCCKVAARFLFSSSCRYAVLWGRFPANAPRPPGGHVKQKHDRTRSCCHPLPLKNPIPAHSLPVHVRHRSLDSSPSGQGEATLSRSAAPVCYVGDSCAHPHFPRWCGAVVLRTTAHVFLSKSKAAAKEKTQKPKAKCTCVMAARVVKSASGKKFILAGGVPSLIPPQAAPVLGKMAVFTMDSCRGQSYTHMSGGIRLAGQTQRASRGKYGSLGVWSEPGR